MNVNHNVFVSFVLIINSERMEWATCICKTNNNRYQLTRNSLKYLIVTIDVRIEAFLLM